MRARRGLGDMKRRDFIAWLTGGAAGLPSFLPLVLSLAARAQTPAPANQATTGAANSIGQVANLTGNATATRGNGSRLALKVADEIYLKDVVQTDINSSLGITFDDQTTFSLSANTRIVIDAFVYSEGGAGNKALFSVATGTAAFVASLVAKTGDMKVATPEATLGIRGTTGIVEVPAGGGGAAPTVKLYPDTDGHVGRIELFDRQGARLGALTQGASAFALRPGLGGRLAAVPFQIPAQEAARDRGVLQRLNASHTIGRQMAIQRQRLRGPGRPNPNNHPNNQPNNQRNIQRNNQRTNQGPVGGQNLRPGPGARQPLNRPPRLPGQRPRKNIFNEPKR
jgi:hypothetical protein